MTDDPSDFGEAILACGIMVAPANFLQFRLRNLHSLCGQIAYVQTLYGDRDMH